MSREHSTVNFQVAPDLFDLRHGAGVVDVPGNNMPAERVAQRQRLLQIHQIARLLFAEVGLVEGFAEHIKHQLFTLHRRHGQTGAVHRDAVAQTDRAIKRAVRHHRNTPRRAFHFDINDIAKSLNNSCKHGFSFPDPKYLFCLSIVVWYIALINTSSPTCSMD